MPGICAVSPPMSAQPAALHAFGEAFQELLENAGLKPFAADVVRKKERRAPSTAMSSTQWFTRSCPRCRAGSGQRRL
jgi:hypothetical protein